MRERACWIGAPAYPIRERACSIRERAHSICERASSIRERWYSVRAPAGPIGKRAYSIREHAGSVAPASDGGAPPAERTERRSRRVRVARAEPLVCEGWGDEGSARPDGQAPVGGSALGDLGGVAGVGTGGTGSAVACVLRPRRMDRL